MFRLLSSGGIYSLEGHILAMVRLAVQRTEPSVFLLVFAE